MRQTQAKKKPAKKQMDWMAYLTEDMDREPKDPNEMVGMGMRAIFRTLHFLAWIYWKTLGFAWKGIKEVYRMVLGRGKGKKREEVQQVPFRSPPPLPSELATSGLGFPQQPVPVQQPQPQYPQMYPQQPQPVAQPMQPVPPAPAPPAQMQMPEQVRAVQNPFIQIEKSFEQMRESFNHIYEKIQDMEREIDDIYSRLNMVQGVQPRPEKRILFRGSK